MKFLHVADVHLDAPLKGLNDYEGAPAERIRRAMNDAFRGMISLAIEEEVDFVVIAGDLYDGEWTSVQTGMWVAGEFRRLQQREIPVYLLRGNHDNAAKVRGAITLPDNVFEFPVDRPGTFRIDRLEVSLHGQGFASQKVLEDLTTNYPDAVSGDFNIGVLHTSLGGSSQHSTYAPTSLDTLATKGYDYWALGHIHTYQMLRQDPVIAYSGCTQGRHVGEQGEKGCLLIEVDESRRVTLTFHPLDVVRWHWVTVTVQPEDDREELLDAVERQLEEVREENAERLCAVRVVLTGNSRCFDELTTETGRLDLQAEIRNRANGVGDIWLEEIRLELSPVWNLDELRRSDNLLGAMLRDLQRLTNAEEGADADELRELAEGLEILEKRHSTTLRTAGIKLFDTEQLQDWLKESEGMIGALLSRGSH